jgi:Fe-S cluster biogenesis protein NfuA
MHTGDLATLDDAGYVNIVGRIKDMIIRGGENIYPREIEEFLYQHPDVSDVQVIGVPSARYGEEVMAWVKLREGARLAEDDLVAHLLILHGLHPVPLEQRVHGALEQVRPYLGSHGGDVELLGVEDGVAHVRLEGTCNGCPSSTVTLRNAIEKAIMGAAPELERIEADGPAKLRRVDLESGAVARVDLTDLDRGEFVADGERAVGVHVGVKSRS